MSFILSQYSLLLLSQSVVDLDTHVLFEFWLVVISVLVSSLVAFTVFVVRVVIRCWPVKASVAAEPVGVEEVLAECGDGDILLFSYPIKLSGTLSGHFVDMLETVALKLQGRVQWTHVGVVLVGADGTKYLAEATTDDVAAGHVGPGLCELRERLQQSTEYDMIAWRKLAWSDEIPQARRSAASQRTLAWIESIREVGLARYKLDFFRASGKMAFDWGSPTTARVLLSAGYPFETDCCMFAAACLARLGVLLRTDAEMFRVYSMPHFCVERETSLHQLPTERGMDWGAQILVLF